MSLPSSRLNGVSQPDRRKCPEPWTITRITFSSCDLELTFDLDHRIGQLESYVDINQLDKYQDQWSFRSFGHTDTHTGRTAVPGPLMWSVVTVTVCANYQCRKIRVPGHITNTALVDLNRLYLGWQWRNFFIPACIMQAWVQLTEEQGDITPTFWAGDIIWCVPHFWAICVVKLHKQAVMFLWGGHVSCPQNLGLPPSCTQFPKCTYFMAGGTCNH